MCLPNRLGPLKFMAQTTYATMFVSTVGSPFGQIIENEERKKERKNNLSLLDLSALPQVKMCNNKNPQID